MLKIATYDDFEEIYRVGLLAANYQPYPVDHNKVFRMIDLFLSEPNEKSIILMYMEKDKCVGMLAARIEEALFHEGTTAVEVIWWLDRTSTPAVSNQLLSAYEFWAKKMKCKWMTLTAAHSEIISRVESVYKRKGFHPVERCYLKEI